MPELITRRNSKKHSDPEKKVEEYLEKRITDLGGMCWKFTSPGTTGVPDRIIQIRGLVFFVELKRPKGGKLSDIQKWRIHQIKQQEGFVYVLKNIDEVDNLMNYLMKRKLPEMGEI